MKICCEKKKEGEKGKKSYERIQVPEVLVYLRRRWRGKRYMKTIAIFCFENEERADVLEKCVMRVLNGKNI